MLLAVGALLISLGRWFPFFFLFFISLRRVCLVFLFLLFLVGNVHQLLIDFDRKGRRGRGESDEAQETRT